MTGRTPPTTTTRRSARGAAPLSEPETAALYQFIAALQPYLVIGWHGYASVVEGNDLEAAERWASDFAGAAGYDVIEAWPFYVITGEMIVALSEDGIPAFDVELDLLTSLEEDIDKGLAGLFAVLDSLSDGAVSLPLPARVPEVRQEPAGNTEDDSLP